MKWQGRRGSRNIEDRRSRGRSAGAVGGVGGLGLIAIVVIGYFLGVDVTPLLNGQGGLGIDTSAGGVEITEADRQAGEFVSVTLADTEEIWTAIFRDQVDGTYNPATLVLFKGATRSPCGGASGAFGSVLLPCGSQGLPRHGFLHHDVAPPWCVG